MDSKRSGSQPSGRGFFGTGVVDGAQANLDGVPGGYRAMNEREAIKVLIET